MNRIRLSGRSISRHDPALIIAEAGVNHNGSAETAKRLIDEAKKAGADCVKFQTFRAEEVATARAPKAAYQIEATNPSESQLAMLKKLELPDEAFGELKAYCDQSGIMFLSTPYSYRAVDLLDRLGVPAFKVASGQLTELPFLNYVARKKKPMIVSTGMATLREVRDAVQVVRRAKIKDLVLLHCTTSYPAAPQDCHLRAMQTMENTFKTLCGYSDHTLGPVAALAAVALGACVIEKHFTLDKSLPGPDHRASMEPAEFTALVRDIRLLESMLGNPEKKPSTIETQGAQTIRRSLTSARFIPKGTRLTLEMVTFKRPATGIAPRDIARVIGKVALQDIPADTTLLPQMIRKP